MVKKEDTVKISTIQIQYSGVFDFDGLYDLIVNWLSDHHFDMDEIYKHTGGKSSDIEHEWDGARNQTDFVKYLVHVETEFVKLKDVEATKGGKKQKLKKGRFKLELSGAVKLDWQGLYKSPFWVRAFNFLRQKVLGVTLFAAYVKPLYYEIYDLHTKIKEHLDMEAGSSAY